MQQGNQRLPLIEDRATGALHRLPLPADRTAVRLSLAPEGAGWPCRWPKEASGGCSCLT
ncbi:hypothetical protein [Cyanobium sp. ATX-6F1]|uniref:hypothetical protein n=1 Tax=Cyanobium sp. ATX-6F1 TaxID=3137388 RepID=UPI0039BE4101